MWYVTWRIIRVVCVVLLLRAPSLPCSQPAPRNKTHSATTVTLLTLLFILCVLPYDVFGVLGIAYALDHDFHYWELFGDAYVDLMKFVMISCFSLNSAINPVIYLTRNKAMRDFVVTNVCKFVYNVYDYVARTGWRTRKTDFFQKKYFEKVYFYFLICCKMSTWVSS